MKYSWGVNGTWSPSTVKIDSYIKNTGIPSIHFSLSVISSSLRLVALSTSWGHNFNYKILSDKLSSVKTSWEDTTIFYILQSVLNCSIVPWNVSGAEEIEHYNSKIII